MKRRTTLSIALALSIVFGSLLSFAPAAKAQTTATTDPVGFITLDARQVLRVAVSYNPNPVDGEIGPQQIRFKRIEYTKGICNGDICKHTIASQNTTAPITLLPGEAVSMDITPMPNSSGVSGVVLSTSRNVRVTASIIDTVTGNVVSVYVATTGAWF